MGFFILHLSLSFCFTFWSFRLWLSSFLMYNDNNIYLLTTIIVCILLLNIIISSLVHLLLLWEWNPGVVLTINVALFAIRSSALSRSRSSSSSLVHWRPFFIHLARLSLTRLSFTSCLLFPLRLAVLESKLLCVFFAHSLDLYAGFSFECEILIFDIEGDGKLLQYAALGTYSACYTY